MFTVLPHCLLSQVWLCVLQFVLDLTGGGKKKRNVGFCAAPSHLSQYFFVFLLLLFSFQSKTIVTDLLTLFLVPW